jgi:8-amino-7-oxononanoate synthase
LTADFTSALYLGIEHGSRQLAEWERLTLGKPAALEPPPGAAAVEQELAALVGCERALLAPSTLHVFWDLIAILSARGAHLFVDDGLYPIGRWGVERAVARGAPATWFRRHDANALRAAIARASPGAPVVVADGFCPACGVAAPLRAYLDCVAPRDGLVLLDDTQALGIFGRAPGGWAPYGSGGGGSLALAGVRDRRIVVVSSLAKAFGAPLAMLVGAEAVVAAFESRGTTRVHCSPPSAAAIAAAVNALAVNRRSGDALRRTLAGHVLRFRQGLERLTASASVFPVQPLRLPAMADPRRVYEGLRNRGVQTVLSRGEHGGRARITFLLTARHQDSEIDYALASLAEVIGHEPPLNRRGGISDGKSTSKSRAAFQIDAHATG